VRKFLFIWLYSQALSPLASPRWPPWRSASVYSPSSLAHIQFWPNSMLHQVNIIFTLFPWSSLSSPFYSNSIPIVLPKLENYAL
jgi:hypothetical protein